MKKILLWLSVAIIPSKAVAQIVTNPEANHRSRIGLVFGLTQPILTNGFNVELNYYTNKFVFDYSHGFNLHYSKRLVSDEAQQQHLAFRISHSLGFGIGYRITPSLNIRLEPKIHIWNMYYNDEDYGQSAFIGQYATYTLGLGAYYRWMPFQQHDTFTRGLTIVPSFRYWPNLGTSLKNDTFEYQNRITNKPEVHRANNIGVSNSPFIVNVSLGYTF